MDYQDNELEPLGTDEQDELDTNEPYPVVIAPLHFALLCIATMGLYMVWWQYKCWKYFEEKEKTNIYPALLAFLFFVLAAPLIPLFNKIAAYCKTYNHRVMYNSISLWLTCVAINFLGYEFRNQVPMLGILVFLPFIPAVMEFNFYFTGNRNGYKGDKLNRRQIGLLIIGAFLWAGIINAILTGNFPPPDPFGK